MISAAVAVPLQQQKWVTLRGETSLKRRLSYVLYYHLSTSESPVSNKQAHRRYVCTYDDRTYFHMEVLSEKLSIGN